MRKEIENWWKQSEYDFETARIVYNNKRYSTAAFLIQQAVEKGLKALYLIRVKESLVPTHSLVHLASKCSVPEKYYRFLKELTPEFVVSRYPDSGADAPYVYYTQQLLDGYFKDASEILKWIRSQIAKPENG